MNNDPLVALDKPGREGSDECCRALLLLHRHPQGLGITEIEVMLSLDRSTAKLVISGLQYRQRITHIGGGKATRWLLTQHAATAML